MGATDSPVDVPTARFASTGIPGLDYILGGGLPADHLFLIEGSPGTGKTTLALQFLLEGVARGEPALYVTLAETRSELEKVAATDVSSRLAGVPCTCSARASSSTNWLADSCAMPVGGGTGGNPLAAYSAVTDIEWTAARLPFLYSVELLTARYSTMIVTRTRLRHVVPYS